VARLAGVRGLPVSWLFWAGLVLLVLAEILFLVPGLIPFTRADPDVAATGAHAYRGLAVLGLGLPIGLAGLLYLSRPRLPAGRRLWAGLVLLSLAMSLGVEVIVIQGDIGRMNTVFKFYLQVWLMWGLAAAAALAWLVPWMRRALGREPSPAGKQMGEVRRQPDRGDEEMAAPSGPMPATGRRVWLGVLAALLFFAALYPPFATSAKIRDRFDPDLGPGLDGWEYMETAVYWDPVGVEYELKWDLEAILWLLDNVVGSPVILEGHVEQYRWGARYAVNTGLPTVVGWPWHQRQQRAAADEQAVLARATDVATIYNAPGIMTIEPILKEYDVRYIVVGPLERAYYEEQGLNKFEWMVEEGSLRVAYSNEEVTIYEVNW